MANNPSNNNANDAGVSKTRLQLLKDIAKVEQDILVKKEQGIEYDEELNKELEKNLKLLAKRDKANDKLTAGTKAQLDTYSDLETSISSISSLQNGLKDVLKDSVKLGIEFSKSIDMVQSPNAAGFMEVNRLMADISIETAALSQLNAEDTAARELATNKIASLNGQTASILQEMAGEMSTMNDVEQSMLIKAQKHFETLQRSTEQASKFSRVQKEVKTMYEEMNEELDAGNKFFQKLINYGRIFFSSWQGAMTVIGFAAGYVADEFGKINAQIGGGFTQLVGFKSQLTAISLILGQDAVDAVTEFGARIGNVNKISNELAFDLGLLPAHLGVSGDEAGKLVNQFGNLQGQSNKVALNTLETTSQLAAANGVIPSQVMKDLASNTELAATYASGFGDNISKAAIDAARLGVDLETVGKISDGLLDYQTSVAAEMEASVLLGKNLNLQKARELAYAGEIDGAMRAALDAAGGIEEFNKMDIFQKKAVAAAIGLSVGELKQMSTNMEEAKKPVGVMTSSFNTMSATVDHIGTTGVGKWLGGFTGLLGTVGKIGIGLKQIGIDTGAFMKKAIWDKVPFLNTTDSVSDKAKPTRGRPRKVKPMLDSVGNPKQIAAAAIAMLAFAGAIYILSQAFAEFDKLKDVGKTLGVFAVAMGGIAIALFGLSKLSAIATPAIVAMLALSAAIVGVGYGLSLIGNSFKDANLDKMLSFSTGMIAFSTSVLMLAGALSLLGNPASLVGLGVLAGVGVAAVAVGAVGNIFGGNKPNTDSIVESKTTKIDEDNPLITKIQALTDAILNQDIILKLNDDVIAKTVRRQSAKSNIPK
jgi:hypothetical protein